MTKEAGRRRTRVPDFQEIGPGKPLSVEIVGVYTGNTPGRWFGLADADLLVTSSVKNRSRPSDQDQSILIVARGQCVGESQLGVPGEAGQEA